MDDDKVMICFLYEKNKHEEPLPVCNFFTTRFAEWLKVFHYCKLHPDIYFWIREDDEEISPEIIKMMSAGSYVKDVYVNFGTDACIQKIEAVLG